MSAILDLITGSRELTTEEYMKRMLGSMVSLYYFYLDAYHNRPLDMDDLVDGVCFLDAKQYAEKKRMEELTRSRENDKSR